MAWWDQLFSNKANNQNTTSTKDNPAEATLGSNVNSGQALPNLDQGKQPNLGSVVGGIGGSVSNSPIAGYVSSVSKSQSKATAANPADQPLTASTPATPAGGQAPTAAATDPIQNQVLTEIMGRMNGSSPQMQQMADSINQQAQAQRQAAMAQMGGHGFAPGSPLAANYAAKVDTAAGNEIAKQKASMQNDALNQAMTYQKQMQDNQNKQVELQQSQQRIQDEIWSLNEKAKEAQLTAAEEQRWHDLQYQNDQVKNQLAATKQEQDNTRSWWDTLFKGNTSGGIVAGGVDALTSLFGG